MSRSMFGSARSHALFVSLATMLSLAGCGGDMTPPGSMCGSAGRGGTTPCSGFTETCAAGQYCDDTMVVAECVPGCTSDANCGANEFCARPVGEPIGACQSCPVCGNGACQPGETPTNCSSDCTTGPVCGDGSCSAGETCPADCGPVCGDFACNGGETPASCPVDCEDTSLAICLEHCNSYNFFECFEPGGLAACRSACEAATMADREQFDSCASTGTVSCDASCFEFL